MIVFIKLKTTKSSTTIIELGFRSKTKESSTINGYPYHLI